MGERAFAPHCDQSILHAPGVCTYCDFYPDWQEMRDAQRINFTGGRDPGKAPCPSEYFRPLEVSHRWPGNTPAGYQPFTPYPVPDVISRKERMKRRVARWIRKRQE